MFTNFEWSGRIDGWITLAAVLCALSCALLGNFMVLRRMSMMGDALSHAVLPGLAAAFLITHSRGMLPMLIGAVVVGVLTALLTQLISQFGKVEESASMGVVFTSLFAVGLIMIRQAADHVDLDPGCVLYGALETSVLDTVAIGRLAVPRVVIVLGIMLGLNLIFVIALFKELKITSFDPALATSVGINASLIHYLLMVMVAATTVVSFEAIGNILVVAMLVVPAAAAHLLTDRLKPMIFVSLVIAVLSGVLGHLSALTIPKWFGHNAAPTSGMMAGVAGLLFLIVMLFAPRHGVLAKVISRGRLSLRIVQEDVLGLLYRAEEHEQGAVLRSSLSASLTAGPALVWLAMLSLRRRGQAETSGESVKLTEAGREEARNLLRAHRLWETYMVDHANVRADHSHPSAERLEHVTTAAMRQSLREQTAAPQSDPHGKPIP